MYPSFTGHLLSWEPCQALGVQNEHDTLLFGHTIFKSSNSSAQRERTHPGNACTAVGSGCVCLLRVFCRGSERWEGSWQVLLEEPVSESDE